MSGSQVTGSQGT